MLGLQSYRLPAVIYNAIKEEGGLYSNVSLTELNKHSAEFVTKAGNRLAAKKKKVVD
ncbi:hypothetical protein DAPPUDRAFT_334579 [Daphnia pulex]|uniref:Uncharacterized protein n=1 Tax=Daphnia pulex TaxID=6669 RepID=E9HVW3_DAPPU|nr:hypothetical protein DAPPUDRAFT_334579 [Daphnia pulex]|eukprot:EFX64117.1 hypothetical protein DAPPUDRAFT_334579 [Daphnia pulex]